MSSFLYLAVAPLTAVAAVLIALAVMPPLRYSSERFWSALVTIGAGYILYLAGLIFVFTERILVGVLSFAMGLISNIFGPAVILVLIAGIVRLIQGRLDGAAKVFFLICLTLVGFSLSVAAGSALRYVFGGVPQLVRQLEAAGFKTLAFRFPGRDDPSSLRVNLTNNGDWYGQIEYFYGPGAHRKASAAAAEARRIRGSSANQQIEGDHYHVYLKTGDDWAVFESLAVMDRADMGDPELLKSTIDRLDIRQNWLRAYPRETYQILSQPGQMIKTGFPGPDPLWSGRQILPRPMFILLSYSPPMLAPFSAVGFFVLLIYFTQLLLKWGGRLNRAEGAKRGGAAPTPI